MELLFNVACSYVGDSHLCFNITSCDSVHTININFIQLEFIGGNFFIITNMNYIVGELPEWLSVVLQLGKSMTV